ncbi:LppP/LprE family lipoprotein [Crocosphaera sp.]|uniref:LppP/LprE family lipoprotein n=1 Tax=Crocosphaera sp. TaxID=2729996 RepID=UPI00262D2C5D|nr:LppP/LprE family lipoprotein [Crocosphaera sp.]MDJ0582333.1 LppP/LprE family lipoprotein [Crocosphaera sp.]
MLSKERVKERTKIWLDKELKNWNDIGKMIPNAPKIDADLPTVDRCKNQIREAKTPQERSIIKAGWELFGPQQIYNETIVITAMSGVDGMCRPLGYQAFVFVGEQFAGTLSPQPMNSRTDGDISRIFLNNSSDLLVEYKRYDNNDPLCCPSAISRLSFKIEPKNAQPLLSPVRLLDNS